MISLSWTKIHTLVDFQFPFLLYLSGFWLAWSSVNTISSLLGISIEMTLALDLGAALRYPIHSLALRSVRESTQIPHSLIIVGSVYIKQCEMYYCVIVFGNDFATSTRFPYLRCRSDRFDYAVRSVLTSVCLTFVSIPSCKRSHRAPRPTSAWPQRPSSTFPSATTHSKHATTPRFQLLHLSLHNMQIKL